MWNLTSSTSIDVVSEKANGQDGVPSIFYKMCAKTISKSVRQIFEKIKQTATYHQVWKQSQVSPVYKKGNKSNVKNCRPVSLLSIVSKVFERCIFIQLYKHLCDSTMRFFSRNQYGFRKKRSSMSQLVVYLEKVYRA